MSAMRAIRPAANVLRAAAVRPAVASRSVLRAATVSLARAPAVRSFSATRLARGSGETDISLSSRLKEEIKYENENSPVQGEPDFIKDFKAQGVWEIKEQEGKDDVEMLRTFGNETVRVFFSIADIDNEAPQFEPEEGQEEEMPPTGYGLRCSVTISKPSGGAIVVELTAEEGTFIIDGVSYYTDAKLGLDMSAEAEAQRRGLYIGPQFDNLDVQVQEEFEKFMQERGVNDELATFVPDFAEYKEQREYVKWLGNVTKFIDA